MFNCVNIKQKLTSLDKNKLKLPSVLLCIESDGVICSVKSLQIVNVSARLWTDGQNKYQIHEKPQYGCC